MNTSSLDNTNRGIIAREKYAECHAAAERVISLVVLESNCVYRVMENYDEEREKSCATAMAATGGRPPAPKWLP